MTAALGPSRKAGAEVHDKKAQKEPLLAEAKRKLGALGSHLDEAEKRGAVLDRTLFFEGGRVSSVGTGAAPILAAVGRAIGGCRGCEAKIGSLTERRAELEELLPRLSAAIEDSAAAHGDRRAATPEVQAASLAWSVAYGAAKDILRGVLTLRGEISRMTWLFHDLAVPAGTKLHTDPGDAPPPATRA